MAEKKSYLLRLPPEVWDALQASADNDLRSVNSQIEVLIREGLTKRGFRPKPKTGQPPPRKVE
jgi:hypothetical protein